jgi:hypothetical protein
MSTEYLSNEIPDVEDTNEVNEESAPVPTRNDHAFVLFIFMLSTMT